MEQNSKLPIENLNTSKCKYAFNYPTKDLLEPFIWRNVKSIPHYIFISKLTINITCTLRMEVNITFSILSYSP